MRQAIRTRGIALGLILAGSIAAELAASSGCAATYVVDQDAGGAADTNPGTEQRPFLTIQRAADQVQPGDAVVVMEGHYDERIKVRTSGTEGKPIIFRAMPRQSAIVGGFDLEANCICVEGFEITAEKPAVAVQLGGSILWCWTTTSMECRSASQGRLGGLAPTAKRGITRRYRTTGSRTIAFIIANTVLCWAAMTGW